MQRNKSLAVRRHLTVAGVLFGIAIVSAAADTQESRRRNERLKRGDGIALLLRIEENGSVTPLRLASTHRPRLDELSAPKRTLRNWTQLPTHGQELVITLHDREGKLLGTYGFPLRRHAFHDTASPSVRGTFTGGMTGAGATTHLLRLPYLRKARFLFVSRTGVVPPRAPGRPAFSPLRFFDQPGMIEGRPAVFRHELLGALPLRPLQGQVSLQLPSDLPGGPVLLDSGEPRTVFGGLHDVASISGWAVHSDTIADGLGESLVCGTDGPNLHGVDSPFGRFNIAILGDGFTADEMPLFQARAGLVADAFLTTWPFSDFTERMNIYRIDVESAESGVDHCPGSCATCPCPWDNCRSCFPANECPKCPCPDPADDPKDTALEVAGNADNTGVCTNFDIDYELLYDTTCDVLFPDFVDLYVVLVNCDRYGARARPAEKTVLIASWDEACASTLFESYFKGLVLHEAGHVVAELGEEYIGCAWPAEEGGSDCPSGSAFRNVATQAQVDAQDVWWIELAAPSEKNNAGFFAFVETYDPNQCHTSAPASPAPLGLYWGAQFIDGDAGCDETNCTADCDPVATPVCFDLQCCDQQCDSRGGGYYRPMPACKMRFLTEPFCRVCDCELWRALSLETGKLPSNRPECYPELSPAVPPKPESVRRTDM